MRIARPRRPRSGAATGPPDHGVRADTRMDLVCGPRIEGTALAMARDWGSHRELSDVAVNRLEALVFASVRHGLRFAPRTLTITMGWVDPDRLRVELTWRLSSASAMVALADAVSAPTGATLDAFAQEWGFGADRRGPVHWMVLDAG